MKRQLGTVRWFDALSGEGMIRRDSDGKCFYVHFTAIQQVSKHNQQWPREEDRDFLRSIEGVSCEFRLIEDTTFIQVSHVDFSFGTAS